MYSRFFSAVSILVFLSLLILPARAACDSYMYLSSGAGMYCGHQFWTEGYDFFSVWVWIVPDQDGVKEASFRLSPSTGDFYCLGVEWAPGIIPIYSADPGGGGAEILVDPCMTDPFLVCRAYWFNNTLDPASISVAAILYGDLTVVTCGDQTNPLQPWMLFDFNDNSDWPDYRPPVVRSCQQTAPDRIRVVFEEYPGRLSICGAEYPHFRLVERLIFPPDADTLEVISEEIDFSACQYCNMPCDSAVAVLTLEAPLDDAIDYALSLDGFMAGCPGRGGQRYVTIERFEPVATLLEEFSTAVDGGCIEVHWSLSARDEGLSFSIERSRNDADFASLQASPEALGGEEYLFTDEDVVPGSTYVYRILVVDREGERILFETEPVDVPSVPLTLSNHPNPFNPSTVIEYTLPSQGRVLISIYDVNGKLVRRLVDRDIEAGDYSVVWNGLDDRKSAQPSGIYFCRLIQGKTEVTSKLVLLR